MRSHVGTIALVAMVLAVAGLSARPAPTQAAFPGAGGRIVFVDIQDGDAVIVSMAADGGDIEQLTTEAESPFGDFDPTWSPGGTMVVFTRNTSSGNGEIWRMHADGSGQKRLTTNAADDIMPTFSADGARIAFSTDRNGHYDIYSMNLDGGDLKRLTTHVAHDLDPAWSPDNRRIAFTSDRRRGADDQYYFEVHTMSATGASQMRQTDGSTFAADDIYPDWHPAGSRLTFTRAQSPDDGSVMFLDFATTTISTRRADAWSSVFAPVTTNYLGDMLWETYIDGDWDIARATRAGSDPPYLVFAFAGDQLQPDWQPIPAFPLVDARFNTFVNDIQWVYAEGITAGCSAERYCPDANVTRAQMAMFLDRALDLPATTTDFFSDDIGKTGEASINRLAASGITGGCAPGRFCPSAAVTRGQMAAFLARALNLPGTATDFFTDDETSTFESSINRVAAAGITGGCGGGKYCPLANVTRGQMAAFLRRALD